MSKHTWVSLQFAPINVDLEEDGTLTVSVNKDAEALATDQAMLGCWFCHTPLEVASFNQDCYPDEAIAESKGK